MAIDITYIINKQIIPILDREREKLGSEELSQDTIRILNDKKQLIQKEKGENIPNENLEQALQMMQNLKAQYQSHAEHGTFEASALPILTGLIKVIKEKAPQPKGVWTGAGKKIEPVRKSKATRPTFLGKAKAVQAVVKLKAHKRKRLLSNLESIDTNEGKAAYQQANKIDETISSLVKNEIKSVTIPSLTKLSTLNDQFFSKYKGSINTEIQQASHSLLRHEAGLLLKLLDRRNQTTPVIRFEIRSRLKAILNTGVLNQYSMLLDLCSTEIYRKAQGDGQTQLTSEPEYGTAPPPPKRTAQEVVGDRLKQVNQPREAGGGAKEQDMKPGQGPD